MVKKVVSSLAKAAQGLSKKKSTKKKKAKEKVIYRDPYGAPMRKLPYKKDYGNLSPADIKKLGMELLKERKKYDR